MMKVKYGEHSNEVQEFAEELSASTEDLKREAMNKLAEQKLLRPEEGATFVRRMMEAVKDSMLGVASGYRVGKAEEERAILCTVHTLST